MKIMLGSPATWAFPQIDSSNPKTKALQGFLNQVISPGQIRGDYKKVRETLYRHTKKCGGKRIKKRPSKLRLEIDLWKINEKYWDAVVWPGLVKYAKQWDCGLLYVLIPKSGSREITVYLDNHPFDAIKVRRPRCVRKRKTWSTSSFMSSATANTPRTLKAKCSLST